jgi:hypothetical protein
VCLLARARGSESSKLYANSEEVRTAHLVFLGVQRPVTACTFRQRIWPAKSSIHR